MQHLNSLVDEMADIEHQAQHIGHREQREARPRFLLSLSTN
jgi:hypothetical protein